MGHFFKKLISLLFLVAVPMGSAHAENAAKETYVIDMVDSIVEPKLQTGCESCPEAIASVYMATPAKQGTNFPKEDIIVEGCEGTLVGKNIVLTAAHCVRRWVTDDWKTMSQGDCSKTFAVYFPKTAKSAFQKSRCKKILSPVYTKSGQQQLEPDHFFIELDQNIDREPLAVQNTLPEPGKVYTIWGDDGSGKKHIQRTCRALSAPSPFTPLSFYNTGSYRTLNCDGDLEQGWSGASVIDQNQKIVGVVSFGAAQTLYGSSYGYDEANISVSQCFSYVQSADECFAQTRDLFVGLNQIFLLAIDQGLDWQQRVLSALAKPYPNYSFKYVSLPLPQMTEMGPFDNTPAFMLTCVRPAQGMETLEFPVQILTDLNTLKPKQIVFNADSTVKGVSVEQIGGAGNFSLGISIKKQKPSKVTGLGLEFGDIHVPYCK